MGAKKISADEAAVAAADAMLGKGANALPQTQMGAEGGLSDKAPGNPMTKGESPEDDDDPTVYEKAENEENEMEGAGAEEEGEEEEDDEEESAELEKKRTKKSSIGTDDLMKALDFLDATSEGISGGEPDRRAELGAKFADGTITKSERSELLELLGAEQSGDDYETTDEELQKSFSEVFSNDDQLATDYEVAPFIERHSQLVAEALDSMRESLTKSTTEQQVFNRALAKSFRGIGNVVAEQGELIKSLHAQNAALSQRLGIVEKAPLPRKGSPGVAALRKSFAGHNSSDGLSEQQITEGLNQLMQKSRSNNFLAPCGEPVDRAIALYETERKITRGMLRDVASELGANITV